ncbi:MULTISPECIES: ornithine carbamoyltransferase [unclassified Agrobacterium]|uniref:ornithine carbamoyltransferase n=1 Tax=unclassified Agrobacterium TaxID=2632611 RepID=UPI0024498DA0|nr:MULTISPECIES: ornithine carbamoyltransferase [unclassified Agrobacterium]MDH0613068.1 ornithine carbamoyltransferase [Agrobacterium sp. GD03872]MDH0694933.1 ornithine carbamoyltransferase [Agrobacterium sp. GD03871]MDH1057669.1 ornithine carbamoyltransferase [Agrobacterium sp. GD03992]MDH2208958.1 ornithine carbamoyltransferase [Agrobacterium sp. GD03643]MDH2218449.1 ornithine carbamoyltransferase [Agrobacterium sp. GD03638]
MPLRPSKDFLEFHDLPADAVFSIIDRAGALAEDWSKATMPQLLKGKRVGLIVDDTGWRNTAAFDLGIQAMGGICVTVPISFNGREDIADLAGYLDNWFDLLIVRTKELATLRALAAAMCAPVVNARTKSNHPCETLGDLAYVKSVRGRIDGLKIVGVAPDANILRSWVEASVSLPIQVTQVYPEQWHVTDAALVNPNFRASADMAEVLDADVVITDSWPAGPDHHLMDYRISASLLGRMRPDAIFLPCPPVARGREVTAEAMAHPACQSRAAKAFLLHAQNALMEFLLA